MKKLAVLLLVSFSLLNSNPKPKSEEDQIRNFQKLIKENEDPHIPHYNLGKIYMSRGNHKKAIEHFRQTIRINKKYSLAHYNLGLSLYYLKNYSKAEKALRKAVHLEHDNPDFISSRGVVFLAMNNPKRAVISIRQALQKNPKHLESKNGMALAYQQLGKTEDAIKQWLSLIHISEPMRQAESGDGGV